MTATRAVGHDGRVIGPLLVIFALVVVIPVGVFVTSPLVAAAFGMFLTKNAVDTHEGSPLVETNY